MCSSDLFRQLNFSNIGSDWSGLTRSEVQAGSLAVLVFALGIVVVYLVLSAQYGSYIDPLIILMSVPLAMLGALVFLVLRGQVNNVYAQVGLVTLIGLAAKNGILIVDLANQRMERGLSAAEAAIGAASSRLRPILMTAMAALAGFFPLLVANGVIAARTNAILDELDHHALKLVNLLNACRSRPGSHGGGAPVLPFPSG